MKKKPNTQQKQRRNDMRMSSKNLHNKFEMSMYVCVA